MAAEVAASITHEDPELVLIGRQWEMGVAVKARESSYTTSTSTSSMPLLIRFKFFSRDGAKESLTREQGSPPHELSASHCGAYAQDTTLRGKSRQRQRYELSVEPGGQESMNYSLFVFARLLNKVQPDSTGSF